MITMEKSSGHVAEEAAAAEGRPPGEAARNAAGMIRKAGGQVPTAVDSPSLPLLVALQVRQHPAGRQEDAQETGGEPNGDFLQGAQGGRKPTVRSCPPGGRKPPPEVKAQAAGEEHSRFKAHSRP